MNTAHNVLVTCRVARRIKEFSSHGDLLRELTLPDDVIWPSHAIQTRSGQFIVCHGGDFAHPVHRVCMISADGRDIVHSHGGQRGSDTDRYNMPSRLAVDDDEGVFVVDRGNERLQLLSPTLQYVRTVLSDDQLNYDVPERVCLDTQRRHLYVADNEWKGHTTCCTHKEGVLAVGFHTHTYTAGCVAVFCV